ncbi:MAG: SDR family NAD(P)-dependent oxidoreductase [Candidatus Binatia bacterium]
MKDLAGKVAVITGAASGVGRAVAARLLAEGMKVVAADVEKRTLDATVAELGASSDAGGEISGVVTDVSSQDSVDALAATAYDRHGAVHLVCNNAGVGAWEDAPLWELPLNDWRWTFNVNVWGVIHGIRAFVPRMLAGGEEGRVVNTSSGNGGGVTVLPNTPIYSTSKSAVTTVTEVLHLQLTMAGAKIGASVLFPGPHIVETNIFSAARNRPEDLIREFPNNSPPPTLEQVKEMVQSAGATLDTTSPESVAEDLLAGVRAGRFWILPASERADTQIRGRLEGLIERRDPPAPTGFM